MSSTMPDLPVNHRADCRRDFHSNRGRDLRHSPRHINRKKLTTADVIETVRIPTIKETADAIEDELARSAYPLHDVRCRCDGSVLILGGQARRYHHVQVALTLAMTLAGRQRIVSEIRVLPAHFNAGSSPC